MSYSGVTGVLLIFTLFAAAAIKFALVVGFFMHLKYDDRRYARFFVMGIDHGRDALPHRPAHLQGVPALAMHLPPWHRHIDVWVILGSVVAAYLVAVRRHDEATGTPTARRTRRLFLGGMAIIWFASDWPMHDLAERYLYAVHMTQHLLYTLVAAPLLVVGIPVWMWRAVLRPAPVRAAWRVVTKPVVALVVFNGILLFTHWPAVVTASVSSELTHLGLHLLLVGSALVMWWPVVSPLPEMPRSPRRARCSTCSSSRWRRRSRRRSSRSVPIRCIASTRRSRGSGGSRRSMTN